jgi:glycosidase
MVKHHYKSWLAAATSLAVCWAELAAAAPLQKLHLPSPDWRDQVIYFVLTDRFADGDPSNNDQGAGEYAVGQRSRYNGGDLKGLTQRLDYIRGLGATAVWITPPVANQWTDPAGNYTGYHGYWAEHFKKVDKHLGSLADYKNLSDALHRRGMYLVQDIVVNHTGNFFSVRGAFGQIDPAAAYEAHDRTHPVPRPSQSPFDRNDPRDPSQRAMAVYHWTPDVNDYNNKHQELNYQMSGLDDLNTENTVVRRALRDSFGYWIREVGVDAFRVDTAFYVPPDYFQDFMRSRDAAAPGMEVVARRTGRARFHVFGEGFGIDKPYQDKEATKIESYMSDARGQAVLPGMLNFPLYGAMGDVFARGRPTAELGHRITRMMQLHARPHLMPTFVDNHDVDRFLTGGNVAGLRQALLALMTLPGIPVIYYGTEQAFTEQRAAMFAAGWASGGRDRYDKGAPLYRDIAKLTALRKAHRVFSRGTPRVLHSNAAQAGALAWTMKWGSKTALVVMNTADHEVLVPALPTQLPAGAVLKGLFDLDQPAPPLDLQLGAQGQVTLPLPARAARVWMWEGRSSKAVASIKPGGSPLTLNPLPSERVAGDFVVSGQSNGTSALRLVVDGELASAVLVKPAADGQWSASVDTSRMVDSGVQHWVTAWQEGSQQVVSRPFKVDRTWQQVAQVDDPLGDDSGPTGRYLYPTDPSWGDNRQMDMREVKAFTAGGALRLEVAMHRLTSVWNPANGFDHVNFTVFIQLPGRDGGTAVMPLQQSSLPEGMRWHLRLRVGGWSNALFNSQGASATAEGQPVTPGASVQVVPERQSVVFTLPAAALGRPASLSGARIYVTTWDYDGGYRALGPQAQPYAMGGGSASDPKVMDDSPVLVLP